MANIALQSQSHCVYDTRYHLVLTTPNRKKLLTPRMLERIEALAKERTESWRGSLIAFRGESDHVRIDLTLPPTVAVAAFVAALKTGTSRRLRGEFASLGRSKSLWSDRYLVLTENGRPAAAVVDAYLDGNDIPSSGTVDVGELTGVLASLSPQATRFLSEQPHAARLALAGAIEAAAAAAERMHSAEAPATEPAPEPGSPGKLLDAAEAAKRLGLSQNSVYYWAKTGKLIAWPNGPRGALAIPSAQFGADGRPLPGIREVLAAVGDPEKAWHRIASPKTLRALRAGRVDEVLASP